MTVKPLLKKILVAINGTENSLQAAMYAIILAKQYKLEIKVVFVVDTATIKLLANSKFFVADEKTSYEEDLRKDGKTYLDYVEGLARTRGVKIQTELREGSVSSEVILAADDFEADLILVGGHNSSDSYIKSDNSKKTGFHSARKEIVDFAHCPVLVVHKKEIEKLFKIL